PADTSGRRIGGALLDQHLERSLAVAIIEADVEARTRLARDEIDDGVADIDRGEFQVRSVELRAAVVERSRHQRVHQGDQPAYGVVGTFGIGDVALLTGDDEGAVERAAPADLDSVADHRRIARLAEDAMVESLAALGRPLDELHRAVHGDAFLVSSDQE